MSQASRIEWTEATWNPTVGCTKISPGCKHCYAETMAKRLQAMGTPGYENGFKLTILPERLAEPLARKKPTVYFVNSMSDLFHKSVDDNYIAQVFDVIRRCPQHTFQVLTKRADRLAVEPLLADVGALDLTDIHWVIVGGESGPKARPMQLEWVENVRQQCEDQGVQFFFKQWGGWGADGKRRSKKANGRLLQGRTWDDMPALSAHA
jgi:protein gp37